MISELETAVGLEAASFAHGFASGGNVSEASPRGDRLMKLHARLYDKAILALESPGHGHLDINDWPMWQRQQ